jgi:hypothetical protein
MITAIPQSEIVTLVCHQLSNLFLIEDKETELINIETGGGN